MLDLVPWEWTFPKQYALPKGPQRSAVKKRRQPQHLKRFLPRIVLRLFARPEPVPVPIYTVFGKFT